MFISENYPKFASDDRGYKIAKVDSCKLTVSKYCSTNLSLSKFLGTLHLIVNPNKIYQTEASVQKYAGCPLDGIAQSAFDLDQQEYPDKGL